MRNIIKLISLCNLAIVTCFTLLTGIPTTAAAANTSLVVTSLSQDSHHGGHHDGSQLEKLNYFDQYGVYILIASILIILLVFGYAEHRHRLQSR